MRLHHSIYSLPWLTIYQWILCDVRMLLVCGHGLAIEPPFSFRNPAHKQTHAKYMPFPDTSVKRYSKRLMVINFLWQTYWLTAPYVMRSVKVLLRVGLNMWKGIPPRHIQNPIMRYMGYYLIEIHTRTQTQNSTGIELDRIIYNVICAFGRIRIQHLFTSHTRVQFIYRF